MQVLGKLDSRKVGIETDMLPGRKRELEDTPHLFHRRVAARRYEDRFPQILVVCLMKLVIGHRVVGTLEPVDMLGFGKRSFGWAGNP